MDPQEEAGDRVEAFERGVASGDRTGTVTRHVDAVCMERDRFLEAGLEGLKYGGKSKALHDTEEELRQARQAIGKLTMELELHEKKYVWRKPGRDRQRTLRLLVPGHDDLQGIQDIQSKMVSHAEGRKKWSL